MPESATLADLRQELHISYSQIRTYLTCPAKFEHQYVRGTEPSHRPVALVFGGAVHSALQHYYVNLQTAREKIAESDFLDVFRLRLYEAMDEPVPILFDEDDGEGRLVDQGVGLLRMFHEKATTPVVLAVEQPFSVDLVDPATGEVMEPRLVGAMDLIVQGADRPEIVEHKTASKRYAQWQLDLDAQPSIYLHAARETGLGEADLRFQLLVKTRVPSLQQCPITRTETQITEALSTVCSVLRAIEAGHFYRDRSWACADCPFRYRCDEG